MEENGCVPHTVTGVSLVVVVPSPSWPQAFWPQHFVTPERVVAHEWKLPAVTEVTPVSNPVAVTGVRLQVVVPSPR